MSANRRVVALFRKASYSPNQHRTNDTAILEETLARLEARDWSATRLDEASVESSLRIPPADLYLNMCQGAAASTALLSLEATNACVLNRPSSVLGCHRHRLVPAMRASGLPFPDTEIVNLANVSSDSLATSPIVQSAAATGKPIWIKRGDVHAERTEDVVTVHAADVANAIEAFRARGISRISLQQHVSGPVVKFYAIADRRFFRFYDASAGPNGPVPDVNVERLRAIAFAAADVVGLSIFGGDVVVSSPDEPVLIDLNDWPSFAPFRDAAADHIADYAVERARRNYQSSSTSVPSFASDLA